MEQLFADIVVVGGGHAGIEAAAAAWRMGLKVRLVTMSATTVGVLSCNPAIGGTAKGQVVKEIDALGGLMGELADATMLQFKMLNRSKGAAVWSPRSQVSRSEYPIVAQERLRQMDPEMVFEGAVDALLVEGGRIAGIQLRSGEVLRSSAVIICAGTFLNGVMHTGLRQTSGGRFGEVPSMLRTVPDGALHLKTARLKTGTPPRVSLHSIDTDSLEFQSGDERVLPFSNRTSASRENSIKCWITHTSRDTHEILAEGFAESPMFSGVIQGKGPRYCPSIEDKIVRFAGKESHHIFLEPEEADGDVVYVNGFSTSLPADVQLRALRTLPGMANVEMLRPGYAVEYDYFPAHQLHRTLESKFCEGLYFAGQVNGTSGYEEAGAQGIVAGINAAAKLRGMPEITLGRDEAYIGVLVDDLISKTQTEPYRLFTSSAEHRLLLRQDNADTRLCDKARQFGLISDSEYDYVDAKRKMLREALEWAETERVAVPGAQSRRESVLNRVRSKAGTFAEIARTAEQSGMRDRILGDPELLETLDIEISYSGYIARHRQQIARIQASEERKIPDGFEYGKLSGLSNESRDVLTTVRPGTIGQASRIPGVTPADLAVLTSAVLRHVPRGT